MTIAVIGAGMVGCATALALRQRGKEVTIYEARPDPGSEAGKYSGRSINLALSSRGLRALRSIGDAKLVAAIEQELMPMHGRMLHSKTGVLSAVNYGISGQEAINSVGRSTLNDILLDACQRAGVDIKYETKGPTTAKELAEFNAETIFGCDGSFSKIRGLIARSTDSKLEMETVGTYYMEVPIPVVPQWSKAHLHIWPRGRHMLIALPNPDGTFTGTLFAPRDVFSTFNPTNPEEFKLFFRAEFPDAASILGNDALTSVAQNQTVGKLTNVKFSPYNLNSRAILLGDAAHSMVPFYGQGLNTGLEDVRILFEQFIDQFPNDWDRAFDEYTAYRKPDCDAIVNLSIANYNEMSEGVVSPLFRARKHLDNFLARCLGDYWLPLYTMVAFRPDVRYSDALASSHWQNETLNRLIKMGSFSVAIAAGYAYQYWKNRK